ncbi:MAG: CHAT domain-containing protein [Planctomycetes bacterium]|nr:CHAT domain-containing protein [Planctomycetota bacterium]MCB9869948.1 CHAT domain-containing protein [Planctomycetota bacterium]
MRAQTEAYRRALRAVQAECDRITGNPAVRADDLAAAARARLQLEAARGAVAGLPVQHRGAALFGLGVWQAQVCWRLGTPEDLREAVRVGVQVRAAASSAGCYRGHYRTLLLIVLWRSMAEAEFHGLLAERQDEAFLLASETLAELRKKWPTWTAALRILRAELRFAADRPEAAVRDLRELAHADPRADVREECNSLLAWHFIELRDFERAKVFLGELPADRLRYPRALIAYQQRDFTFAAEQADLLRRSEATARNHLLYANAVEGMAQESVDPGERRVLFNRALLAYLDAKQSDARAPPAQRDVLTRAAALNGQGDCLLGLGNLDRAERAYREVLTGLAGDRSITASAELAETHKDLGRLAEHRGDATGARAHYRSALDTVEAMRRAIPLDALGIAWLQPSQLEAVDGYLRLAASGAASALEALWAADRMQARGVLDWMEHRPSPRDLQRYRTALRRLSRARTGEDLRRDRVAFEQLRTVGQSGARRSAAALTAEQLSVLLKVLPSTTVLWYWLGKRIEGQRVYLITATAGHVVVHDLGAGADGLASLRRARTAVAAPSSADPWPDLDAAARFFLPESVELGAAQRLVVCVDPALHGLPFEALRRDRRPIGSSHAVFRAPSLAVLARLRERTTRSGGVLVVDSAEPPTEQRELHQLSVLAFSAAEAELVARSRPVHRLHHAAATFARIQQELRPGHGFGWVHVSSHAIAHAWVPSASLLMLSDGPLDMGALAGLDLTGMFVVFSACSSAGGTSVAGEGVKGLLWGPFGAGARGVVASHWAVNQQATKDLMGQFHYFVAAGHEPGEAMRRARAALAAAPNYAHPSFWAGFGVYAAPGADGADRSMWGAVVWPVLGGGFGVLLCAGWWIRSRGSRRGAGGG